MFGNCFLNMRGRWVSEYPDAYKFTALDNAITAMTQQRKKLLNGSAVRIVTNYGTKQQWELEL